MVQHPDAVYTIPSVCPGSNAFVDEDSVDGNGVTRCPSCARWTLAHPVPGITRWLTVRAHSPFVHPDRGVHSLDCEVAIRGVCTCESSGKVVS